MIQWFQNGGVIMWPLLLLALVVVGLAVRSGLALGRGDTAVDRVTLTPILFWGAVAFLVGALGTVVGVMVAANQIAAAGEANAALIWSGVSVALTSLVFGILVFLLAGLLWIGLDGWSRRLEPGGAAFDG